MKQQYIRMGLAFLGFAFIGAVSGGNGVVLPSIGSYYHVDNSVLGLLFLTSSLGYFLSAFTSSIFLVRFGMRNFLALGVVMLALGTLLIGVKPPFAVILATRLFLGLGFALIETGLNAFVVTLPRNTSQLNSLHAFYGAGALIGPVVAGALLTLQWGWNSVYLTWTVLALPLALGVALAFNHYQYQPATPVTAEEKKVTASSMLMTVLRSPVVWWISIFLLLYVGIETSLGNWSYNFLVAGRHQPMLLSSWMVSGYWLGLTLGRFILAATLERWGIGNIGLIYLSILGVVISVALMWLFPAALFAGLGLFLLGFSLGPIYPTTVATMPKFVASQLVPSAIGFLVSISIVGIAIFPWLAGILAQLAGAWSLLPYTVALAALMLVFWWITARISGRG